MMKPELQTHLLALRAKFAQNLPDRVAAISESLRKRQEGDDTEAEGTLDRHFHNLAGTAGTFGFFAIAAAAADGFDECTNLKDAPVSSEEPYLWSIVEELANEAHGPFGFETGESLAHSMDIPLAPMNHH